MPATASIDRLTRGLGWFSLALGAAEIAAPGRLARALGLEGRERTLRGYGMREIGAGAAVLSAHPEPGLWSRIAGDGLDLFTLSQARPSRPGQRRNARIAIGMVAGITLLDIACTAARALQQSPATRNAPLTQGQPPRADFVVA